MAITNPTKYVTTRRLGRFKTKADALYATKTEVQQILADAISAASDANDAADSANDAARAANEAAAAAAAAVVVAELPAVATESNVRAIVSNYSPSSAE